MLPLTDHPGPLVTGGEGPTGNVGDREDGEVRLDLVHPPAPTVLQGGVKEGQVQSGW